MNVTTKFNINQIAIITQNECYEMAFIPQIMKTYKDIYELPLEESHG